MDTYIAGGAPAENQEAALDLSQWLCVSGDIDDFIYYYDDEPKHSER